VSRIIFGGKLLGETAKLTFDFTSRLAVGESISSASTSATTYSGTDGSPSSLISGAASISSGQVAQTVTGGTLGVTYLLTCTAVTSTSQHLTLSGFLAVVPDSL
jgi:hypothetical protein